MIKFEVDHDRCLRAEEIKCNNCVKNCVMKVLGIKDNKIVMIKPELCINCHNCIGACMVDIEVIKVWEEPDFRRDYA
jgi:NAD-dependent dihydropyrimidine dehydrogenase PreA subunit